MRKIRWWLDTQKAGEIYEGEIIVDENATEEEIEYEARQEAFNCIEWGYEEIKEPVSFVKVLNMLIIGEGDVLLTVKNNAYGVDVRKETLDVILAKLSNKHLDTGLASILLNSRWYVED